jgi:hypothetical protein
MNYWIVTWLWKWIQAEPTVTGAKFFLGVNDFLSLQWWIPEPVWMPSGNWVPVAQPEASRFTNWTIPAHKQLEYPFTIKIITFANMHDIWCKLSYLVHVSLCFQHYKGQRVESVMCTLFHNAVFTHELLRSECNSMMIIYSEQREWQNKSSWPISGMLASGVWANPPTLHLFRRPSRIDYLLLTRQRRLLAWTF